MIENVSLENKIKKIIKNENIFEFIVEEKNIQIFAYKYNDIEIVVKKSVKFRNTHLHEAIIGILGLNNLSIPNFCHVYGYYQNRVVYEYVEGVTYREFLLSCNLEEFLCVFMQILLALNEAYLKLDFTHYDLHTGNIIIKNSELTNINYIKYNCKTLNKIPVIIDYGLSYIKINNQSYGCLDTNVIKYNTFRDRSFIMYDVYRILMYSIYKIWQNNTNFDCQQIMSIYDYFAKIDVKKEDFNGFFNEMDLQYENFFIIPYTKSTGNISEHDYYEFKKKYNLSENYGEEIKGNYLIEEFIEFYIDFCEKNGFNFTS